MRSSQLITLCSVIAPFVHGQTVYLAGDSTMAKGGGGNGTDGERLFIYSILQRS